MLGGAKVCKLVLAEVVWDEVEENLLFHAKRLPSLDAGQWIEDYRHLIKLTNPELVPYPDKDLVHSSRHLIRTRRMRRCYCRRGPANPTGC